MARQHLTGIPVSFRLFLIASCLFLLIAAMPHVMAPGLSSVQPFQPYLAGTFPDALPVNWQWTTAMTGTGLNQVITSRRIPGTNTMAFGDIYGKIYTLDFDQANPLAVLLGDMDPIGTFTNNRFGLKGIAFHPEFGQATSPNRAFIYVAYMNNDTKRRLSRFAISEASGMLDPASELVMIEQIVPGGSYHNTGELIFGHDGFLYVPFGDAHGGGFGPYAGTPIKDTIMNVVQRIDHNLSGGILRIDVDMDPTKSHPPRKKLPDAFPDEFSGVGYWIPNDNPWLAADSSQMEEYYSLGHRNPWKMTIDPLTGEIWNGEVGPHNGEEINKIKKGHNYGWPYKVGPADTIVWDRTPPTSPEPSPYLGPLTQPVFSPQRTGARSIYTGCVYRGTKFPELYGKLICADVATRNVWAVDHNESTGQTALTILPDQPSLSWNIFEGPDGEIYLNRTNGTIMKLEKGSPTNGTLPTTLSATAAFTNLSNMTAAAGFIPYAVNTPLWSDRALKKRWIALPNDGVFDVPSEKVSFSEDDFWEFPEGTVIVKHFELPIDESNPAITTKLETRFIIIGAAGRVYGVTYKWRADQTDADLLPGSDTEMYTITDKQGGTYTQIWDFPDRSECLNCHNQNAGQILGINSRQLNGDFLYPSTGITDNQLNTWNHLGIFDQTLGASEDYAKSVALDDPKAIRSYKVRSYLDANCSYCHRPGGVTAAFDGRLSTSLEDQGLINEPVLSAGSHESVVVVPGDPIHSELWIRDNSIGADAMPPLAKNIVDTSYIQVLTDWIDGLQTSHVDTLGELGHDSIDHHWQTLRFERSYKDPVIIAGAPSYNDSDPVTVRIRNLSSDSCQIRLDEWECQDGLHVKEEIGYIVVESGIHLLPNGQKIMAGTIAANHNFQDFLFPEVFPTTPAVLAQVMTNNEAVAVGTRFEQSNLSQSGFRLNVQEEEGSDGIHANENVGWIAAEIGKFDGYLPFEMRNTSSLVEEFWVGLEFDQDYENRPVWIGQISSNYGPDPCGLRQRNPKGSSMEVFLEEEQCGDAETGHFQEDVSYMSFASEGFLIGTTEATDLPVELLSFEAKLSEEGTEIAWNTAFEINNSHFELEKSQDGSSFFKIATIEGSEDSQTIQSYSYLDGQFPNPVSYYRLKQIDLDGSSSLSDIVSVSVDGSEAVYDLSIYPNPTNGYLNIGSQQLLPQGTQIQVFDLKGRTLFQKVIHAESYTHSLDLNRLNAGIYLIQIKGVGLLVTREIFVTK